MTANDLDPERFRLRRLVEQLAERDEVEVHDEPVALADLSSVIEASPKAVLFRKAGPEQLELVAGVMGSRNRLAVALAWQKTTACANSSAAWPARSGTSRCRHRTRPCTRSS